MKKKMAKELRLWIILARNGAILHSQTVTAIKMAKRDYTIVVLNENYKNEYELVLNQKIKKKK